MTDSTERGVMQKYIGKLCKIFCSYSIVYHGKILECDNNGVLLKDKYGKDVFISFNTIRQIEVV
jgi:hypothetical protein